jgi:hypothetical protein
LETDSIIQELSDKSSTGKWVSNFFKAVFFNKFDAFGKEVTINSSLMKYWDYAKKDPAGLAKMLYPIFEEGTAQVIKDLSEGKITEDIKFLVINDLADVQPIFALETPEGYLRGGNGRIFYSLKTFQVKLLDVYRNKVFIQMKTDPKLGMKNFLRLTASLMLMGATSDILKDLLFNRPINLTDLMVDNILKLAGFSKFLIYKTREEGPVMGGLRLIAPPSPILEAITKDLMKFGKDYFDGSDIAGAVPVVGRLYYWWFGPGAAKTQRRKDREELEKASPGMKKIIRARRRAKMSGKEIMEKRRKALKKKYGLK